MAPLYPPNRNESQSSTLSNLKNDGALTSQDNAGYADTSANTVQSTSSGRLPTRSERAPIIGSQNRFEAPTHNVTIKLSRLARWRALVPSVGVYAVIR